MQILLNGKPRQLEDAPTIAELLRREGYAERRVAVEVNHAIVPRSVHAQRRVKDGDDIEIVQAMGGG